MWGEAMKVYGDIDLYKKLPLLEEYMFLNSINYEVLGINPTKKQVPKSPPAKKQMPKSPPKESTTIKVKGCQLDNGIFTNFGAVTNAGYCSKNNILHGVKCSSCNRLFISGSKKPEDGFDMSKYFVFCCNCVVHHA
jgi:hypothetical protein